METVERCLELGRRKNCPLPSPKGWKPDITLSWSPHHRTSHGSKHRVFFAMNHHLGKNRLVEYKSIANEPAIGSIAVTDPLDVYRALACHEVAHALQFAHNRRSRPKDYNRPHGPGWKRLYAYLRHETGLNDKIREEGGGIGSNAKAA
jgi:hypothetical protein